MYVRTFRYMGVATAVPTSEYDILSVDITKIGETKRMKRAPKPTFAQKLVGKYVRPRFTLYFIIYDL